MANITRHLAQPDMDDAWNAACLETFKPRLAAALSRPGDAGGKARLMRMLRER